MAILVSPGINTSEINQTTVVPSVLTTAGAIAGNFKWGPVDQFVLVDSELTLVNRFGQPDSNTATSFFTAANFLAYGNNLTVVRSVGSTANNASVTGTTLQIKKKPQRLSRDQALSYYTAKLRAYWNNEL